MGQTFDFWPFIFCKLRGSKARSILEYSISVGIGGIQGYLAPLFNGAIADLPFETRRLIVKADPAQLLDQARPVTRAGPLQPPQKPQVSSSDPSYQIAPSDDPAFVFSLIWICPNRFDPHQY